MDIARHLDWYDCNGTEVARYIRHVGVSSASSNRNVTISSSVQLRLDAIVDSRVVVSADLARQIAAALVAAADRLDAEATAMLAAASMMGGAP